MAQATAPLFDSTKAERLKMSISSLVYLGNPTSDQIRRMFEKCQERTVVEPTKASSLVPGGCMYLLIRPRLARDLGLLHLFQEFIEHGIDLIRGFPVQEVLPR